MTTATAADRAAAQFSSDTLLYTEPYGKGHINVTYAAWFQKSDGTVYRHLLQQINTTVFPDPAGLMDNIAGVTDWLRRRVSDRETLTVIPTLDGRLFFTDEQGLFWRCYVFIEGATAYQRIEKDSDFDTCGESFGRFQELLSDYPTHKLRETIPHFHDTPYRYAALHRAIAHDPLGRAASVREEIRFALARESAADALTAALEAGDLPRRVTHNDTKLNNILIDDKTGQGLCVIDLDTVMPGAAAFDFGDCIRFGANTAAEDETDLHRVSLDLHLFEVFSKGYLRSAAPFLTASEVDSLAVGARLMTLECGVRFLTDYLEGDVYFRIHRPQHNLDRCRTQFRLVADMEEKETAMQRIVQEAIKG